MTDTLPNDGLLKAARLLTGVLQVLLGILFIGVLIASPIVMLNQEHFADDLLPGATYGVQDVALSIVGVLLLGAVMIALAWMFLRLLKQVIHSVGDGDPFIQDNADRLTRMGWLAVSIELLKLPAAAIAALLVQQTTPGLFDIDLEFSLTGFLLALVLFILARVFRHGAAMRADLEGTV